jgi:hypothetical protein
MGEYLHGGPEGRKRGQMARRSGRGCDVALSAGSEQAEGLRDSLLPYLLKKWLILQWLLYNQAQWAR